MPGGLEDPLALRQDPFITITNTRKCKAHQETFDVFVGRPRGDDPNHVILGDAGMAMAKRVLHPQEVEKVSNSDPRTEDETGK